MADLKPFTGELDTPGASAPDLQPFKGVLDSEKSGVVRRAADTGIDLLKGAIGVPEAAVGVADLVSGGRAGKALEGLGYQPKVAKDMLGEFYTPERKAANAAVQGADGFLPTLGAMVQNPSTILGAAAESAPSMLLGGGVARGAMALAPRIGPVAAGALGEGVVAAGQNAEQVRQETPGGLLPDGAAPVLAASGALTGGISLASGGLANKLGIGDVNTMLASGHLGAVGAGAAAGAQKGLLRKAGEGFITEGALQELPQSMQEQAAQNIAQGKPLTEGVGAAGAQGLLVGGLTGAIAGPLSGGEPAVPAPKPGPFTAALGLPAPTGPAPITVGPDGKAQTQDQRNQAQADSIAALAARGAQPGDITEVAKQPVGERDAGQVDAAIAGQQNALQERIRQRMQAPSGPATAALASVEPTTELLPAIPPATTQEQQKAHEDAHDRDQAIYDQIFGQQDVSDVEAKKPNPMDSLLDADIPWDAPSNTDEPTFLKALGFSDDEVRDAIANTPRRPQEGGASDSGTAAPAAAGPSASAGPAQAPAQADTGQEVADAAAKPPAAPAPAPAAAEGATGDAGDRAARAPRQAPASRASTAPAPVAPVKTKTDPKDLFRTPAERIGARMPDVVEHTTTKGKVLRGVVRKGMTLQEAKAIDSGSFAKGGGMFIRERAFDALAKYDADKATTENGSATTGTSGLTKPTDSTPQAPTAPASTGKGATPEGKAETPSAGEQAPRDTAQKKPVTPQIPNEPGTKYVLPTFATGQQAKAPKPAGDTGDAGDTPEARWTRMPTAEREALLQRDAILPGLVVKRLARGTWASFAEDRRAKLQEAMDGPPAPKPVTVTKAGPGATAIVIDPSAAPAGKLQEARDKSPVVQFGRLMAGSGLEMTSLDPLEWVESVGEHGEIHATMTRGRNGLPDTYNVRSMLDGKDFETLTSANVRDLLPAIQNQRAGLLLQEAPPAAATAAAPAPKANTIFTEEAYLAARALMKKKLGTLNSGIDPELLQAGIVTAGYHIEKGARTFAAYARAMLDDMGEAIRPYLKQLYLATKFDPRAAALEGMDGAGAVESADLDAITATPAPEIDKLSNSAIPAETPDTRAPSATETVAKNLSDTFYKAISAGNMPKNNIQLRHMVAEFDGGLPDAARMKTAQEALEAAIMRTARDLVTKNRAEGPQTTFAILRRLYDSQPSLNIRTSTSVANQAYSTPAPLAFLTSELARIGRDTSVYEPTAGTGMLLIGANPASTATNELDPARRALLKGQGFEVVTPHDASDYTPKGRFEAVVMNPPFGSVKNAKGEPIKVEVDGYRIGQIDHLIAARALEAMKDDGRAVLVLGANKVAGGRSNDDLVFFNWLYSHYNVAGHFEVSGDLYTRQGAGWPVRVITINGRLASERAAPEPGTIQRANTWEEVYERYADSLATSGGKPDGLAGRPSGSAGAGQTRPQRVPVDAGGQVPSVDRGQSPAGPARPANVAGARPGDVPDRGNVPTGPVAAGVDPERLGAESVVPDRLGATGRDGASRAAEPGRTAGSAASLTSEENQFQTAYVARSARKDANVLIPVNMAQPTQDALSRLEDEVGDIDQYLISQLGYKDMGELHDAFMGLQVDSVAAAIHQIDKGNGIVIADQTGIGKGRQAAAMIRWAVRKGYTPVFVSVKPSLFTDMYGDLADIGTHDVVPFVMNKDAWVAGPPGPNGEPGEKMFANKGKHRLTIEGIRDTGALPGGANAVFMTYSQINVENVQRQALSTLSTRAVFILDEAHNAAGESQTGEFMRDLLGAAKGVTYLSATYAKRPDNMPLYFKTDIGKAMADDEGLMDAMSKGGLPLQTVVSNNLVQAGQMFRRERSYDGVNITSAVDSENRVLHEQLSDRTTVALRAIVTADKIFHEVYFKELAKQVSKEGARVIDNAGNQAQASVQHTEFSSVVHNFVKQMLLGLKAKNAADRAVALLKADKKPLIAVENTMGSFLDEFVSQNGIEDGGGLGDFGYRTVLSRALSRTLVITHQDKRGVKVKKPVPLSDLDPVTRRAYRHAQDVIDALDIDIPVSPIDAMRQAITDAGYSVAEITGRKLAVDYSTPGSPALSAVDQLEQKDKVRTTRLFNAGQLDALILNVSGSTGISLHASEKFDDQRQRHMIVAQPAGDINIVMQMLGRIHRTGQVALPEYTMLSADLPTEKRPTALLSKKMKSLNANTSSNTDSATSIKAADMLNKYGDQVIATYLSEHPTLSQGLGIMAPLNSEGTPSEEDIARKATGRMALQPIKVQKAFYDEVETQYEALINYLNATGQNELEPRTLDLDAREMRQEVLFEGGDPTSPFGEDAIYGEYSVKAQGEAMKPAEIKSVMSEHLQGKTGQQHVESLLAPLEADFNKFAAGLQPDQQEAAGSIRARGAQFIRDHAIGKTFRVDINGDAYNAVVTNIRSTHKAGGNPFSMSKTQVTIAVNGALRSVTVPASAFERIEVSATSGYTVEQLFKEGPPNQRETFKIVTGNLLAAYGELEGVRGTIISFTKQDGTTAQGILLPKVFDFTKNTRGDYRLENGAAALRFLQQSEHKDIGRFGITTRDGQVRVLPNEDGIRVQVPKSKLKGAKYFLDKGLIGALGDFVTAGNFMVAKTGIPSKATEALDLLMKKQALYALPSMAEEAKAIAAPRGEQLSAAPESIATDAGQIPGIPTVPASAARQAKAAEMAKRLGAQFVAVEPGDVTPMLAQSLAATRTMASRLFGHDVVFVQFPAGTPPLFNGAVSAAIPGTVFIRIDSGRPHMAILGHELLHHLRTTNPRLYNILANRLDNLYKAGAASSYFDRIKEAYAKKGLEVPESWDEEQHADIVGDHFMDPEFWRALAQRGEPGPFRMVINAVLHFLDRLKRLMTGGRPFGSEQMLTDLDEARRAVVDAMAQFSADQMAGRKTTPMANARALDRGAMLSIATDPKELYRTARQAVDDFANVPGGLNWWHKTVGSPYNLAQRNPAFKRVFDSVQRFLGDVSKYAHDAAELAPRLMPRMERIADLKKSPISAADNALLSKAVFEGTLNYTRDERNQPILMKDLLAQHEGLSDEQKANMLLRKGKVTADQLSRWKAAKIDVYEGAVRNRFESAFQQAGIKWTDAELKSRYGMTDAQVSLFGEYRAALNQSLDDLSVSEMLKYAGKDAEMIRPMVLDAKTTDEAAELLRDHLQEMAHTDPAGSDRLLDAANKAIEIADRVRDLKDRGYAPLSRFGQFTLEATTPDGERYFGMFESNRERMEMMRTLKAGGATGITAGTMNKEAFKMLRGMNPESAALFGEFLGLDQQGEGEGDKAYQTFLKKAISGQSALRRMIHRQGIAGFNEDSVRGLADFITSNARRTATNLHAGEITGAVTDIPKEQGQVQAAAQKLASYVSEPTEEAGALRGLLFAQYIGGSIASAMVNLTQPIQTTIPYLSQFGGARAAARNVVAAAKMAAKASTGDRHLDRLLEENADIVSPQEIHQLQGIASGEAGLRSGDGTTAGNALAHANNARLRLQFAWGKLFSTAEAFNRRLTFIAAYNTAKENGNDRPVEFARKAIAETQFVANKGNRPEWARGAVGATLFTFKSYSVSYIEMLGRMASAGQPGSPERAAGRRAAALALGLLMLMGGAGGLPFEEDLGDLIDGIMQRLGYAWNTKQQRKEFLASIFGDEGGRFVDKGISGISDMPLDISGRMGMGNLIPGTGLLAVKKDYGRDVAELFGPAGDLAQRGFKAAGDLVTSKPVDAAFDVAPRAVSNLRQAADMAATGHYRDTKGRNVIATTTGEALTKAIGFAPNSVARVQEATGNVLNMMAQVQQAQADISSRWASGIAQKDPEMIQEAQADLKRWNARNPETPVRINLQAIMRRARSMEQDKVSRLEQTAPKALRAEVRQQLAEVAGR